MHDAEAIVVGAGPAGSTFATALAEAGRRVLLLDKAHFPRHKACSDYVNPAATVLLDEMGVLDEARRLGASRMDGMIVHAPNGSRFTAHYTKAEPGRAATGLSRIHLDNLLLERAKACGVTVIERAHVREIVRDGDRVHGVVATIDGTREELRAPLVVGADGRHSVVARELGLSQPLRWPHKTGLATHYRDVTGLERFGEMHIGHGVYAGLAIIENGLVNLTIVNRTGDVQDRDGSLEDFFAGMVQRLPEMARKLDGAERVGGIRGVGPMGVRSRRVAGDGYLLIGDAAAFLDPFAGEGVYEALCAGLLAAPIASEALKAGDTSADTLDAYRIARRRTFTAKRTVSWLVQAFVNTPPAMNYVTPRLASREDLGLTMAGVLGGFQPPARVLSPVFLARMLRP